MSLKEFHIMPDKYANNCIFLLMCGRMCGFLLLSAFVRLHIVSERNNKRKSDASRTSNSAGRADSRYMVRPLRNQRQETISQPGREGRRASSAFTVASG